MYTSEETQNKLIEVRLIKKQIKELEEERELLLQSIKDDFLLAILKMMDWKKEEVQSWNFGTDQLMHRKAAEVWLKKDPARYVFHFSGKDDGSVITPVLDFRENIY